MPRLGGRAERREDLRIALAQINHRVAGTILYTVGREPPTSLPRKYGSKSPK